MRSINRAWPQGSLPASKVRANRFFTPILSPDGVWKAETGIWPRNMHLVECSAKESAGMRSLTAMGE